MSDVPVKSNAAEVVGYAPGAPDAAPPAKASAVRASAAAVVPYLSYGVQRVGTIGVAGISLCVFSLVAFIAGNLPLHRQYAEGSAELDRVRGIAEQVKGGTIAESPRQRAAKFVQSLPEIDDVPKVLTSIIAVASASGIELERGTYEYVAADGDTISRYQMSLPVTGTYPEIRRFVEDVLATIPAVALDSLRIERGKIADNRITADLKFSILLGGAA